MDTRADLPENRIPPYVTALIISGLMLLHWLTDPDDLKRIVSEPARFTVFRYTLEFFGVVAACCICSWPFWALVRAHVKPRRVSYGLFVIFAVFIFVTFDLFDRNVVEPIRKAQAAQEVSHQ